MCLYEPNDSVLMEYKGGLEKAILSNRTLLDELNDAFCKTHPWLYRLPLDLHMLLLAKLAQMHYLLRH